MNFSVSLVSIVIYECKTLTYMNLSGTLEGIVFYVCTILSYTNLLGSLVSIDFFWVYDIIIYEPVRYFCEYCISWVYAAI